MTKKAIILAVLSCLVIMSACAPPATAPSSNLSLDMRRMQATVSTQNQTIENLSQRLASIEASVEQQRRELDLLKQSETAAPNRSRSGSQWSVPGAESVESPDMAPSQQSPTEVYLQAFGNYASGRYALAVEGFDTFLERYPNNGYASNAQFWLGDCYYSQQQFQVAVQEFQKVLDGYPRAPKSAEALLKIASAQLQLGKVDEARQSVARLTSQYPDSTAAKKAEDLALPPAGAQ